LVHRGRKDTGLVGSTLLYLIVIVEEKKEGKEGCGRGGGSMRGAEGGEESGV